MSSNEETIKDILVSHQALMSLEKGQITRIVSWNKGSESVREFRRIK